MWLHRREVQRRLRGSILVGLWQTHEVGRGRISSQTDAAWSSYVQQSFPDPPRLNLDALISDVQTCQPLCGP
jgi:hypothetical protein